MASSPTIAGWLGLAVCVAALGAPAACGGNAFSAAPGDGGTGAEGSSGSSGAGDAMGGDGQTDGPGDAPSEGGMLDGTPAEGGGNGDLHGFVVDAYLVPMGNVAVHAQTKMATTAADGSFTLPGIATPYEINIILDAGMGHKHAYVFQGLARRNPTLQLAAEQAGATQGTSIDGRLGTNGPTTSGIVFVDFPAGAPAVTTPTLADSTGASTYSGTFGWAGPPTAPVTIYSLQWLELSGAPSGYVAYTSTMMNLTNAQPTTWDQPASSSLGQGSMTVTIDAASGFVPVDTGVFVRPQGARIAARIYGQPKGATPQQVVVTPDIPSATFVACGAQVPSAADGGTGTAYGMACSTKLSLNDSPTIIPPAPTTFVQAPAVATVGTNFSWQPLPTGVYLTVFAEAVSTGTGGDALFVVTSNAQTKIPDLGLLGYKLSSGSQYVAEVYGFAPFTSIDDAVGATGFGEYLTDTRLDVGPSVDGAFTFSGVTSFVVQ